MHTASDSITRESHCPGGTLGRVFSMTQLNCIPHRSGYKPVAYRPCQADGGLHTAGTSCSPRAVYLAWRSTIWLFYLSVGLHMLHVKITLLQWQLTGQSQELGLSCHCPASSIAGLNEACWRVQVHLFAIRCRSSKLASNSSSASTRVDTPRHRTTLAV